MVMNLVILFNNMVDSFENLPLIYQKIFTVAFFMSIIVLYSIFVWKVYRAISRKDIISLNLAQYNSIEHPVSNKILGGVLYFIEYILILPFLVLFWYVLFALVLLFFSDNSLEQILLLSVVGLEIVLRFLDLFKKIIVEE